MLTTYKSKSGVEMPAFWDGKEHRLLGRIKTDKPKMVVRPFTEYLASINAPVIDLNQIPDYDRYQKNVPILDQNGNGSCVGHAHCSAMMKARDMAGYEFQALSADSLYAQINGGRDAGSDPADAITALEQNGICLLSDVPDTFVRWENIPTSAKETAKRFRISSAAVYQCSNFAEMVTADYLGFSVTMTVNVGPGFNPGSDGVVGFWPGYANHSICAGESLRTVNGQKQFRFRNSWTTGWGINGCAYLTQRHIDSQPGVEIFCIMWPLEDDKDATNPPRTLT